jgi:hypothetical protein
MLKISVSENFLVESRVVFYKIRCLFLAQGICIMRQTSYKGFSRKNEKKLARSFNFTFRYIDDVLSLNNSRLGDFPDRNYKLWNIVSSERYILHMQVLLECCYI